MQRSAPGRSRGEPRLVRNHSRKFRGSRGRCARRRPGHAGRARACDRAICEASRSAPVLRSSFGGPVRSAVRCRTGRHRSCRPAGCGQFDLQVPPRRLALCSITMDDRARIFELPYHLADDWLFLRDGDNWQPAARERRRRLAGKANRDVRACFMAGRMFEFVARSALPRLRGATRSRRGSTRNVPGCARSSGNRSQSLASGVRSQQTDRRVFLAGGMAR